MRQGERPVTTKTQPLPVDAEQPLDDYGFCPEASAEVLAQRELVRISPSPDRDPAKEASIR
jgi:hypothetical protein